MVTDANCDARHVVPVSIVRTHSFAQMTVVLSDALTALWEAPFTKHALDSHAMLTCVCLGCL